MGACSRYLSMPVRTLREACRDLRALHPDAVRDCCACTNDRLCATYEAIARGRGHQATAAGGPGREADPQVSPLPWQPRARPRRRRAGLPG